jgi:predicted transcriptional regulator
VELVSPYLDAVDALIKATEKGQLGSDRNDLLAAYLDLLLEHRDIARVLDRDISAVSHPAIEKRVLRQSRRLRRLLAGDRDGAAGQARAEAAIGALRRPVLTLDNVGDPAVRRLLVRVASAAARAK